MLGVYTPGKLLNATNQVCLFVFQGPGSLAHSCFHSFLALLIFNNSSRLRLSEISLQKSSLASSGQVYLLSSFIETSAQFYCLFKDFFENQILHQDSILEAEPGILRHLLQGIS